MGKIDRFSSSFDHRPITKSYSHFFSKKFQHIFISLDANFNESLTNDVVSFEQLGPAFLLFRENKTLQIIF